jgi:hypothetical protein
MRREAHVYPPPKKIKKMLCVTRVIHIRFRIEMSFSSGSSCVSICQHRAREGCVNRAIKRKV